MEGFNHSDAPCYPGMLPAIGLGAQCRVLVGNVPSMSPASCVWSHGLFCEHVQGRGPLGVPPYGEMCLVRLGPYPQDLIPSSLFT